MKIMVDILKDFYVFFSSIIKSMRGTTDKHTSLQVYDTSVRTAVAEKPEAFTLSAPPVGDAHTQKTTLAPSYPEISDVRYVAIPDSALFAEPVDMFDGVLVRLEYGTPLVVHGAQGRWFNCSSGDVVGWILKDNVRADKRDIYPTLVPGGYYGPDDAETIKLRTVIQDAFNAVSSNTPLEDGEFVIYSMMRKGRHIQWPNIRPRVAGMWCTILKNTPGVHISPRPDKDSVMEYARGEGAHIAYVDAVFPDESIVVRGVRQGEYYEDTLEHDVWTALNPQFINVS